MALALKKHLEKMAVEQGDLLLIHVPNGVKPRDTERFAQAVHEHSGCFVVVLQQGVTLERLRDEDLQRMGLARVKANEV